MYDPTFGVGFANSRGQTNFGSGLNSPFFNVSTSYGGPSNARGWNNGGAYGTSPAGTILFNNNPEMLFQRQTQPFAWGSDPFSQFVRGQQANFKTGYQNALTVNPNLDALDYAHSIGNNLSEAFFRQLFSRLAPSQRGESASNFGGGRLRWVAG